jgi:hypothetical protein
VPTICSEFSWLPLLVSVDECLTQSTVIGFESEYQLMVGICADIAIRKGS